jgi:3-oxoacyl-[acyl-carrier protein] reductase
VGRHGGALDDAGGDAVTSKVAVVTGATRGIGKASAIRLAADGWTVAVGYRSSEGAAKETIAEIEGAGGRALAVFLDTTDESSVQEGFRRVADEAGNVTGLVNNAGFSQDGLLLKYPIEAYDLAMDTNVKGAFLCAKEAMRGMLREKWGRIVNVSSAVALHGNAGQTVYAATKTALLGLTKSLAREIGAKGITVNAICPGLVDTEMTAYLDDRARAYYVDQTPIGRTATLDEVAAVIGFLMSEEASYVNGAVLPVDGGLTA